MLSDAADGKGLVLLMARMDEIAVSFGCVLIDDYRDFGIRWRGRRHYDKAFPADGEHTRCRGAVGLGRHSRSGDRMLSREFIALIGGAAGGVATGRACR
jgi:hypothetical protein